MELFQELTFSACLAVILSFVVVKVVSFAVCKSSTDAETAVCSLNEGQVPKEATLNKTKIKKRVMFVDDVVVKRFHRYESENDSENLVLSGDLIDSAGKVIVGENKETVDQFGGNEVSGDSEVKNCYEQDKGCKNIDSLIDKNHEGDQLGGVFGENEKSLMENVVKSLLVDELKNEVALGSDDLMVNRRERNGDSEVKNCYEQDKGCKNIDILIGKNHEGDKLGGVFGENEKSLVENVVNSVLVDELKNEVALGSDDLMINRREGNGVTGSRENEGLIRENVEEKMRYEDDDWVEIERFELLDKDFAEVVN